MRFIFVAVTLVLVPMTVRAADPATDPDPGDEAVAADRLGSLTLALDPGKHAARVTHTLFTPDSTQLLTVGRDRSIRLWDTRTGEMRKLIWPPGTGPLSAVALSADGTLFAVACSSAAQGKEALHAIELIRIADGRLERTLHGMHYPASALAFSADGKRLAACCKNNETLIWILDSDKPRYTHKGGYPYSECVAFSPDGTKLVRLESEHTFQIIDVASGEVIAHLPGTKQKEKAFRSIVWSPDGKRLAANSTTGIHLWDTDGTPRAQLLDKEKTQAVEFSKDSQQLRAVWVERKSLLLQTASFDMTGKLQTPVTLKNLRIDNHTVSVNDGFLSPDGKVAVTTETHVGVNQAYVWNTEDGKPVQKLTVDSVLHGAIPIGWSPDGKSLAWQAEESYRTYQLDDLNLGNPLEHSQIKGAVTRQDDVSLEHDPRKHGAVRVLMNGQFSRELELTKETLSAMTLVGKDRALLAGTKGSLVLYEISTGKVVRTLASRGSVCHYVAPSPDGKFLVTASRDGIARLWSIEREKPLLALCVAGQDWILWTPGHGYYAATPGGERLIGLTRDNGIDKLPTVYPVERFRPVLLRPDIIKLVRDKGSVEEAIKAVNAKPPDLEQALPPTVKIERVQVNEHQAVVRVVAECGAGQQIRSLRLLLDGRGFPDGKFADLDLKASNKIELEWKDVPLPPGKHELKVLVRGPDSSDVSDPTEVVTPVPENDKPAMHVIAVGIDNYQDARLTLHCAEKDARDMLQAFKDANVGKYRRFREPVNGEAILGKQATTRRVLDELMAVKKKARPGDLVVFFFAGHGVRDKLKGQPEFFLLTYEAVTTDYAQSALPASRLREALKGMPCQVLLILDACHSAGGFKNFVPITDDVTRSMTDDEAGVTVLAAALPQETAGEVEGNGRLTAAMKKFLVATDGIPFDPYDHVINIFHIYSRVYDEVRRASNGKQHPMLLAPWTSPPVIVRNLAP